MTDLSSDDLAVLAAELNTAWSAYTDHVAVPPDQARATKERLAAIVMALWESGMREGIAEAALAAFDKA